MTVRELKEVQAFVRGKWITTKALVSKDDICRFPLCNKKIPSVTSNYRNRKTRIPEGYCSVKCKRKHERGEHKMRKLDEFTED